MRLSLLLLMLVSRACLAQPAVEQIRQIVLHQEDSPRALAHLVQLTRELDDATSAQLFLDLSDAYLAESNYNQAADFLQQLVNQHPSQPATRAGLLRLIQLYSSSEVNHIQQASHASADEDRATTQQNFCKYALHIANNGLRANKTLADDPALTFQRAAAARGANLGKVAQNLLTRMKHDRHAKEWRQLARVEQWLQENQQGDPPLQVLICQRTRQPPHLDGVLTDPLWQSDTPVQLACDERFLYFAVRYPKAAGVVYQPDPQPRTHDADLSEHDHVRLSLDLDRDFATSFELDVDHRGWTAERCWRDASWNPNWFVAAGGDASHWTVEAAIAWEELTSTPPQSGTAWAIAIERVAPTNRAAAPPPAAEFQLLLFE